MSKNGMRWGLSIISAVGIKGLAVDKESQELIIGYVLVPEGMIGDFKKKIQENKAFPIMENLLNVCSINPSSCHIEAERKVDDIYKGHQVLLINSKVSFKNASLDKQYFLIEKGEAPLTPEQIEEELKRQFFERALKKLPLPIKKEWEGYIWGEIQGYFTEMNIHGTIPYEKVFCMKLPGIEMLQELVEYSHKCFEFKETFKRVPQLKGVILGTNDIANFNFKEWSEMLNIIGGQEEFRKLTYERQKAIVSAFELLGADKLVLEQTELWHSTNTKQIGVLIRKEKDKNRKQQIKVGFKKILEMFADEITYLYAAINSFPKLFSEEEQNIRNGNAQPIKDWLNKMNYEEVEVGAEELANVCSAAKVSDSEYKLYESQYLEHLEYALVAPRSYPTIRSDLSLKASWELLDMTVPRAWVVGAETHCCMHPSSCGGECLLYAAKNPETSGILRIAFNGKTSAQSFMWLSAPDKDGWRVMVLDNIEIDGKASLDGLESSSSKSYIIDAYKDFAEKIEFYHKLFRIKAITIGTGYSDIGMSQIAIEKVSDKSGYFGEIPRTLGYSDASSQWLLKKFK